MRPIDADALKELFSEVIGHIAKKPEMNGNLEHMIRASAMVIQMIDDAPTVQPDTTTHDSIPAETGKNNCDRTSGDCISRQQAIDALLGITAMRNTIPLDSAIFNIKKLPSIQPEQRWIPVSERLPENGRQVLVYARSVHFALAKYDEMREADGTYKKQWVTFDSWKPFYTIKNVIAWMPLPEPYEERR